jgi:hypothetical protein
LNTLEKKRSTHLSGAEEMKNKLTIANPTSAFFKAGPSFVPSPVTATTSRVALTFDAMIPLTRTYLS